MYFSRRSFCMSPPQRNAKRNILDIVKNWPKKVEFIESG
ncbi:hypothetical protein D3OALGB2SA_5366 [Olavius algarvensis associated proteobacterium Delta 3]|nr:hypothetical protein D3OALGB2SA_5366 [Olavius algarvensis associated proteobacterium Delta 3]